MARFNSEKEVSLSYDGDWKLCFQYGEYHYDEGDAQSGYRFIWRRPDDSIQARGPARIPSIADMFELLSMAVREGWDLH